VPDAGEGAAPPSGADGWPDCAVVAMAGDGGRHNAATTITLSLNLMLVDLLARRAGEH